nr:MAG TPA: hypothetical protein [Caudoviricetes sp.]
MFKAFHVPILLPLPYNLRCHLNTVINPTPYKSCRIFSTKPLLILLMISHLWLS